MLAATLFATACAAQAESYPAKTVRVVVHNNPGSAQDVAARQISRRLSEAFGKAFVVDNRPGGGGITGTDVVARAAADGLTLLVAGDGPITILPNLGTSLPYDPRRDLVPVVSLGEVDFVLVTHPKTGWRTLADFVNAARQHPGRYNYASAGNGSPQHLAAEQLKQVAGIQVTHIPYGGGPAGLTGVLSQDVDVMFIAIAPALQLIQGGKLVALAVGGDSADPVLPGIPPVANTYKGFRGGTWLGLFAPTGTPPAVLQRLSAETTRALAEPSLRGQLLAQGIRPTGYQQPQFRFALEAESKKYALLLKSAGIHAD
ncbi:tripartite tricarboxylate transporter substrate-binding protein [Roseateles saccharophilus]|uniref:Tripartite-type tricarboxylate transporter receptor subunit TctC n=2 Tax=Roseateles saccharophilus TaxID=304 RepID=A0A4R3USR2_ROSSA|nr:tripartite tricarboxylate transporter substrate-binding protein [Roseateles saccharophilus]MDG0833419.1 tripartite tricarboxylate transporter substrate binding protein [Roseateles saccharophilus]TCU93074.1 tripartite-type tricarboxylate transporter receptor subunit TctC [Roseateles saccharophilus]